MKEYYPYCEHPELSLAQFGVPYHSLKVPDHVEAISNEKLHDFLNLIILSYDLNPEILFEDLAAGQKALRNIAADAAISVLARGRVLSVRAH